jgi:hypothetical protein
MNMKRPGYRGTAPMWTAAQALVELADTELGGGYYLAERAETG